MSGVMGKGEGVGTGAVMKRRCGSPGEIECHGRERPEPPHLRCWMRCGGSTHDWGLVQEPMVGSGVHREWKREREVAWVPGGNLLVDFMMGEIRSTFVCHSLSVCPSLDPSLHFPSLFSLCLPLSVPRPPALPSMLGGGGQRVEEVGSLSFPWGSHQPPPSSPHALCWPLSGRMCGPWAECLSLCASSQPPASPSTQEAIQGMLSMANLQASDSCLQTTWGAGQAKGSSLAAHGARKNGAGGKSTGKRLLKRAAKNSVDLDDYEEEQDHLDACFKDSDYGEHACPGGWEPDLLADVIHRP